MPEMKCYQRYLYSKLSKGLGHRIIEIGAGYGNYTERLLDRGSVLATDVDDECLRRIRVRLPTTSLQITHLDLNNYESILACRDFHADSIFCVNVLEHIRDDIQSLKWLRHLVVPGGGLALLVPAHPFLYGRMDREAGHYRRYTRSSLVRTAVKSGWVVEECFYINAVGAIGWWVHNCIRRNAGLNDSLVNLQMRLSDRWLPRIAWLTDSLLGSFFGLSLVLFAHSNKNLAVEK